VVVKCLKSQDLSPSQIAEFIREAEVAERVGRHPHVVTFIGACIGMLLLNMICVGCCCCCCS
jgi:hypothetical protein